jgi:hypothetical protein
VLHVSLGQANFCTIVSGIFSGIAELLLNLASVDTAPPIAYFEKVDDLVALSKAPTTLTWAVCSLVLNTVLSTSIIAKIV